MAYNPKLNAEAVLLLDQHFLKASHESLRRPLRASQKASERDLVQVQTLLNDIIKKSSNAAATSRGDIEMSDGGSGADKKPDVLKELEGVLGKMTGLKRKLSDQSVAQSTQISRTKARIQHLQSLHEICSLSQAPPPTPSDTSAGAAMTKSQGGNWQTSFETWSKKRLDRQICEYLLRRGLVDSAAQLSAAEGIEDLVDLDLFQEMYKIEDALRKRRFPEALAWCKENQSNLRKMKSILEFFLRLQEYIELCRDRDNLRAALTYVQRHLIPAFSGEHLAEIQHAMALLAFAPDTTCAPYQKMYNPTRWDALVTLFRITFFSLHSLPSLPSLSLSLYAGLASLKLPSCFPPTSGSDNVVPSNLNPTTAPPSLRSSPSSFMPVDAAPIIQDAVTITHATSNVDCPTCDLSPAGLGPLAQKEVPHVQHLNSTMVCGITGTVMEGENEPMVLPNGRVYSSQALEAMALANSGKVRCPRTGEWFNYNEAKKIFIS